MARTATALVVGLALALPLPAALAAPVERDGGHWYELVDAAQTWSDAQAYAVTRHAHLATIEGADENGFVQGLAGGQIAWIGATDNADEGTFTWATAEPFTYANWAPGEPDDDAATGANGDAVAMLGDGTWADTNPTFTGFVQVFVMEWSTDTPDLDGDGLYGNEDPDDDNDGVLDGEDGCPETDETPPSGCPVVSRSLTLSYSKSKEDFKGALAPSEPSCIGDDLVTVWKQVGGDDKQVGVDEVNAQGKYVVSKRGRPGKYYSTVNERVVPDVAACGSATSPKLRLR